MNYVLDSCVALKWVLPEIDSDKALRLRGAFQAGVHALFAPDVFCPEVGHALTRAERKGIIPVGDADVHTLNILSTPPQLLPSLAVLRRAIAISSSARVSVYDCIYVALAEREQCELVTSDQKLITALQPTFPFIRPLSSLP